MDFRERIENGEFRVYGCKCIGECRKVLEKVVVVSGGEVECGCVEFR